MTFPAVTPPPPPLGGAVPTWATIIADLLLIVAALGCIVFVVLYSRSNWKSTDLGRNVMAFMAICAILLTLGVVRALLAPPDHVIEIFRIISYGSVGFVVWWRVVLLFRYQHDPPPHNDDDRPLTPPEGVSTGRRP